MFLTVLAVGEVGTSGVIAWVFRFGWHVYLHIRKAATDFSATVFYSVFYDIIIAHGKQNFVHHITSSFSVEKKGKVLYSTILLVVRSRTFNV
jgi:F0F1-type ATP synthase assembly protein I